MSDRLAEAREEAEERQKRMAQRAADKAAAAEAVRRKRRRLIRIEVTAFVASAIAVVWILYYDTTKVADDFYALHFRFGNLIGVHEGGRVYRIPILDRVVLIDRGGRPLPALRRTVKSAGGTSVNYESLLTYSVVDVEKYWMRFHTADAEGAQLVTKAVEAASLKAIAQATDVQLAAPDAAAKLAAATSEAIKGELAEAGLAVRDLRFVTLRLMQ